ncbi:membrane protein insertion efficiency factor YidD [Candidatus Azambacteria bacterium]|nr:membrane protein insertion efficiency factor YidD [Candidatus Azambacteria bacterium]MBI3685335.1 membrane protein insertion efficiency factor YidD [Candidatus Azambacteria bacterium]
MTSLILEKTIYVCIRAYQRTISPDHGIFREHFRARGIQCRFYPTCSEYFLEAMHAHGILKGMFLGAKRIARCRPGADGGYNPVTPQQHPPHA